VASGGRTRRDGLGSILGIAVFLGGVALLLLTFRLAYDMFQRPPQEAIKFQAGQAIDFGATGNNLTAVLVRVLLLVVMGLVASLIANRGVLLYSRSLFQTAAADKSERPDKPALPEQAGHSA